MDILFISYMANEFVARKGLIVSGSTQITGSLQVTAGITGSLFGTSSWANNVLSSSFATTASAATSITFTPSTAVSSSYPFFISGSSLFTANSEADAALGGFNVASASFIGIRAGTGSSYADYSTIIGTEAGFKGSYNAVYIGYQAGWSTVAADNSVIIGYRAGRGGVQNAYNSNIIGSEAGAGAAGSTNLNNSNIMGWRAGFSSSATNYVTLIGDQAGAFTPNARRTTFIGSAAGYSASAAGESVFVGNSAGYNAASASYSILIGRYAGYVATTANTIGTNNIIIGNSIGLPSASTNSINIGGIIFATGSYNTFATQFTGSQPPSVARVGINVVTPRYNLDVSGSGNFANGLTVTGSLLATASWATNAATASLVTSASFASTASFVNILNQTVSASGDIIAQSNLVSRFSAGDEGGEIQLSRPQTNTSLSGSVVIDVNGNRLRIFESNLPNRGGYWDITSLATGVGTNLAAIGGGGTVTSITAGDGLSGGTISSAGTISLDTGSAHFVTGSIGVLNLRGVVSSSTQINYAQLQNIPAGIVSSSLQINTGSFSGSFTGRLVGSSSFADNAGLLNGLRSSVFATTGSNIFSGSQTITGSLAVAAPTGETISTVVGDGNTIINSSGILRFRIGNSVELFLSPTSLTSISTRDLGNSATPWRDVYTGRILVSGSSIHTGSLNIQSGSINIVGGGGVTSSLFGTSSWANNAISASFSTTASFALNTGAPTFPYDGRTTPAVISGSLIISGSTTQGLFVTGSTTVLGAFQATTKSFKIDHQRLPGKSLIYGVLEGPEHAVYVRGRVQSQSTGTAVIQLPEDWEWLVDENSITVQLTPIDGPQELYVQKIQNNTVTIKSKSAIDCFYLVHATRKDVPELITVE